MSDLNPRQREAVRYLDGPLLVLAGAGSGKTSVITRKIAYLIDGANYDPSKIIAVTFTNKAAREMAERAKKLVGSDLKGLSISTFHTLGLNIIRSEQKRLGLRGGFSILDADDSRKLITELMQRDAGGDGDMADTVQHAISSLKNDMVSAEDALAMAKSPREMLIAQVYEGYERAKNAYNAVDFDDLILKPVQLFTQHGDALEKWQNRTRYLLVDEYQDTNLSQYRLVRQLTGVRGALTVVGDDDQSIYAWRGARPENLVQLKEDFPQLKVVALEQNYRSTQRILRAANTVIANNPHVFEKKLWSDLAPGEPIRLVCCKDEQHEAERIAGEIVSQHARGGKWKDFAVLYRGNFQSRLIEEKLRERQVPYKVSGGQSFFARAEIKDLMAYLRLLANPDDDTAFLRVINVPRREIGPTTLEKLAQYAGTRHVSLATAAGEMGLSEYLGGQYREKLGRFVHWLEDVRRRLSQLPARQAMNEMLEELGYEAWLRSQSSSPAAAQKRMENVQSLVDSIHRMSEKEENGQRPEIGDVIAKLVLLDMLDQQAENDDTDRVQLMTLHAAKGLEFPQVWILAFEEEILPHRNSIEANTIEEERRLLYVGITRARRQLTFTYAQKRKQFGDMVSCTPSRFIAELPEADLAREGEGTTATPEQKTQSRDAALAALDALFKK
ncbi:MAG: DNA helicase Rep [Pseudomonadota bacterium]